MGIEDELRRVDEAEQTRLEWVRQRESRETSEGWDAVREFVVLARQYGVSPRPIPAFGVYTDSQFFNREWWHGREIFESSIVGWTLWGMKRPYAVGVDGKLYQVRMDVKRRKNGIFSKAVAQSDDVTPTLVEEFPIGHHSSSNSYDESGGSTVPGWMTEFLRTKRNGRG